MKIHFYLRYHTQFGESFSLRLDDGQSVALECLNDDLWHGSAEMNAKSRPSLGYSYVFHDLEGNSKPEANTGRGIPIGDISADSVTVFDYFNPVGALENVFDTQPFHDIFLAKKEKQAPKDKQQKTKTTHIFRIKSPLLKADEVPCLLGHGAALRNWDTAAPILLSKIGKWWEARLDLSKEDFPLGYKYGVWNTQTSQFIGFEEGGNRTVFASLPLSTPPPTPPLKGRGDATLSRNALRPPSLSGEGSGVGLTGGGVGLSIHHDNYARFPNVTWKGAGVAVPVFSLRSQKSWGVGEFTDMHLLVDWAKSVGLKLVQLLPINDSTATHTWLDSYPYSAVSAFALHPIYLNVEQLAGKKHATVVTPFFKRQKELNALEAVDYEGVLQTKWDIIRQLYDLQKADWLKDAVWLEYYESNKHWLAPYAAFCWLRDMNGTADFNQWSSHKKYKAADIEKLFSPLNPANPVNPAQKNTPKSVNDFDQIAIHLFVQWHLHLQLKAATDYAHANGIAVKGDIPIGIYRYSCDAWVAPELYNMDKQAGAPPDDFAEKGQNWGFPTYNWERMKKDGFRWWRQRFEQMSLYFDAFRIDHILGFFRIWSIPLDAVEGILGQFVPAIPVTEKEFHDAGIGFDYDRFCKPYITEPVVREIFGAEANWVGEHCLKARKDERYDLLPAFDTQRKVEAHFAALEPNEQNARRRDGLYSLVSNVILFGAAPSSTPPPTPPLKGRGDVVSSPTPSLLGEGWGGVDEGAGFHFRFGIEKTTSFQHLPDEVKEPLKALYVNYFYRRQDDFWQEKAMEKLPDLKRSTNMLICGEDLGMVPHCVPDVMKELGILSLEIQRMPKATGATFFHPKDAPYLSVVTPSTHDMSTIRGWWEENRELSQRFFNEMLGYEGTAPWFCEPWLNRAVIAQHFHSPAMWSIFQLQDLLGSDEKLRRENPNDERINVPANPRHYWQYRVHISLEDLMQADGFNADVRKLVGESGRG